MRLLKFFWWSCVAVFCGLVLSFSGAFLYLSPGLPSVESLRSIQLQIPLRVYSTDGKLIAEFGGEVPRTRAEIESLPGAGRKTANVVLNMAFGERTMAVDTHVFRVGNRTGLAPGKTPLEVELGLEKVIPTEFMLHAHHWLILHGRYTCLARGPRCEVCLINDLCRWPEKTV